VITKNGESLVPLQNWRGMFALATRSDGYQSAADIDWPGFHTTPWHGETREVENWWGSLSTGMRDASGQVYMRNRYYDPASGQFTQPDPVGLAGGLNSYGFAAGDPVNFSDPFGLKVCYKGTQAEVYRLRTATEAATGAQVHLDRNNCIRAIGNAMMPGLRGLRNRLELIHSRPSEYDVGFRYSADTTWRGSTCMNNMSHFCPEDQVVEIDEGDIGRKYPANYAGCYVIGALGAGPKVTESLASIIAHELLGHAWSHAVSISMVYNTSERRGVIAENNYHRTQPGGRQRCLG
jgi:RHS repeat-associated protein